MNKAITKKFYRIVFTFKSALSISNGENENTDKDLLLNKKGEPYVPASSLAGVYRSLLDEETANKCFGYVQINRDPADNRQNKAIESEVIVYDANLYDGNPVISIRDGVALDEYKTAVDKTKYDYEILEPGCSFITYIEFNKTEDSDKAVQYIVDCLMNGDVSVGGKTSRGLGEIGDVKVQYAEFKLEGEELAKYLDFDMYSDKEWNDYSKASSIYSDGIKIEITLKQNSALSIREYRTDVEDNKSLPDYQQMSYGDKPFIPGTSFNGLFRHALSRYGCEKIDDLFGDKNNKSKVIISETLLEGSEYKVVSRNSIDRFSAGTTKGALFTEKVVYGGSGVLKIVLPKYRKEYEKEYEGICCALVDLHQGILALGGETSIGHGLFNIEAIRINNNENFLSIDYNNPEKMYMTLKDNILKENG